MSRGHLLSSRRLLLDAAAAAAIVDDMEAAVRRDWYPVARACAVSEADCEAISRAYVDEGFRGA